MKSIVEQAPGMITFSFEREDADVSHIEKQRFSMNSEDVYFVVPEELGDVHPDLIGLATILLCNPFVSERLALPLPTSRLFFETVSSVISRYEIIEKIDEDLAPIELNVNGNPGLCFSGGADSAAALSIMPGRTIPIFLNRPMRRSVSHYDSSAPLAICELLENSGFNVQVIESNLEYIRSPTGFPTDLANAIPAILLSQHLGLDSIAFGTVLESGFGIGHEKFIDYGKGSHFRFYSTIFSAVGIGLNLPILGISEVGTGRMGLSSPVASISQSCIRGKWKKPCKNCWKCFRKILLSNAISGEIQSQDFERMLKRPEVQIRLSSFPISHENVIAYSIQRIDISEVEALIPLAAKLDLQQDLAFLERWYPDSIEFVPDKYRNFIRERIMEHMDPGSYEDMQRIREWDMGPHLSSSRAIRANDRLINHWQSLQ